MVDRSVYCTIGEDVTTAAIKYHYMTLTKYYGYFQGKPDWLDHILYIKVELHRFYTLPVLGSTTEYVMWNSDDPSLQKELREIW